MKEIVLKPETIPAWIEDATSDVTVSRKGMADCARYITTEALRAASTMTLSASATAANGLAKSMITDASEEAITSMLDAAISEYIAKVITTAFNETTQGS